MEWDGHNYNAGLMIMLNFYEEQVKTALQAIKEAADLIDTAQDIREIERMMDQIQNSSRMSMMNPDEKEFLFQEARRLNHYLRNKYPEIEEMLFAAQNIPKGNSNTMSRTALPKPEEYIVLEQDYYGILWGVLIKKGYVKKIEEYIKRVT